MDASQGKDVQGSMPPEIVRREQVRGWLETGFNQQAVAAYGTGLPTFLKILENGSIPPIPENDPNNSRLGYRGEFRKSGGLLYYFNALGGNLRRVKPSFYNLLIENAKRFGATKRELTTRNGHQSAKGYANVHAIEDEVSNLLGMPAAEVDLFALEGALDLDYDAYVLEELKEMDGILGVNTEQRENNYRRNLKGARRFREQLIAKNIDIGELNQKLDQMHGVVVYFNSSIFEGSTFFPGEEKSADEFVLARNLPLGFISISGIEILGEAEREELEKKYEI